MTTSPSASTAPSTPSPLPTAAPRAQGVDAAGVARLLDALEALPGWDPHALVLLRGGAVVAQGAWAPHDLAQPQLLYSLSKSFTSAAVGLAQAEGLLDLDDRLLDHLPELDEPGVAPALRGVRLRHLAAMSSGHLLDLWRWGATEEPGEPLRAVLATPPEREPGTVFAYHQSCTHALAAVVARRAGTTLTEYLRPRLLDPLGAGPVGWTQQPPGRDQGFSGLHAAPTTVAALGQLLLDGGRWQGRQLLPAAWVAQATRAQVATPHEDRPDWQRGYGYQHWVSTHGFRGDGAYGQFLLVLPEHGAVLALTGETTDMQAVLDVVWAHLPPALAAAGSAADDAALADRLAALAHAPLAGAPAPADPGAWDGLVLDDAVVRPGDVALRSVRVHRTTGHGDGDGGWRLALDDGRSGGWALDVALGAGAWATTHADGPAGTVPVAASAAWRTAAGREALHAELRLLATPHRLQVSVDPVVRTARARWVTAPLDGSPLARLGVPGPLR